MGSTIDRLVHLVGPVGDRLSDDPHQVGAGRRSASAAGRPPRPRSGRARSCPTSTSRGRSRARPAGLDPGLDRAELRRDDTASTRRIGPPGRRRRPRSCRPSATASTGGRPRGRPRSARRRRAPCRRAPTASKSAAQRSGSVSRASTDRAKVVTAATVATASTAATERGPPRPPGRAPAERAAHAEAGRRGQEGRRLVADRALDRPRPPQRGRRRGGHRDEHHQTEGAASDEQRDRPVDPHARVGLGQLGQAGDRHRSATAPRRPPRGPPRPAASRQHAQGRGCGPLRPGHAEDGPHPVVGPRPAHDPDDRLRDDADAGDGRSGRRPPAASRPARRVRSGCAGVKSWRRGDLRAGQRSRDATAPPRRRGPGSARTLSRPAKLATSSGSGERRRDDEDGVGRVGDVLGDAPHADHLHPHLRARRAR